MCGKSGPSTLHPPPATQTRRILHPPPTTRHSTLRTLQTPPTEEPLQHRTLQLSPLKRKVHGREVVVQGMGELSSAAPVRARGVMSKVGTVAGRNPCKDPSILPCL